MVFFGLEVQRDQIKSTYLKMPPCVCANSNRLGKTAPASQFLLDRLTMNRNDSVPAWFICYFCHELSYLEKQ